MKKISIIVPVLNEEKVIEQFHKILSDELKKLIIIDSISSMF